MTAPIIGATKTRHLDDPLAALELTLDDDEFARIEARYGGRRLGPSAG